MLLINRTIGENLSFEDMTAGWAVLFVHAPPVAVSDRVFHPSGGGIAYIKPDLAWLDTSHSGDFDYGHWTFPENVCLQGDGSCPAEEKDIFAILNYVTRDICLAVNRGLGINNPGGEPPEDIGCPGGGDFWDGDPPVGGATYYIGDGAETDGAGAACLAITGCGGPTTYVYYQLLYER